jgi:glycosyltransferase involved in cell wall biosynthesis
MRVSVVIPAYNEEQFIGGCLQGIMSQTIMPDELIVVDNNCTDDTVKIARSFGARVVRETRQGIGYARNRGFDSASHEVIVRFDADCLPPPHWIERVKEHFARGADAAGGATHYGEVPDWLQDVFKGYHEVTPLLNGSMPVLSGANYALTREMWDMIRDRVETDVKRVHEDINISIHIRRAGGTIVRDKDLIVDTSSRRMSGKPFSFFLEYPLLIAASYIRS